MIFVDDAHDMGNLQYDIVKKLCPNDNLTVAGNHTISSHFVDKMKQDFANLSIFNLSPSVRVSPLYVVK